MKDRKTMTVSLLSAPSLEVLEIYVKRAKEKQINYIYFDVPVPLEVGLKRTYFYLEVL